MSNLINEFKQAAGIDYNPDQEGLDLFAKLIVQDIHEYVDSMDTAQIISRGILKRYGVTE